MTHWAFIYEQPGCQTSRDRHRVDLAGQTTDLIPVSSGDDAAAVASAAVDEGATLIELCGGFDTATVATVIATVGHRAAVGHVTYSVESLAAATRYAEEASAGDA